MTKNTFLRNTLFSLVPLACALSMTSVPAAAQSSAPVGGHLQNAVYDGSRQAGWYSFPGQSPKLKFKGNDVRIQSREESTVLLSREAAGAADAAEVALKSAPASTSSISGLAVLSDAQHALVIGLAAGNVVLWQLDPGVTKIVAHQPVNSNSPLEFRVTGTTAADIRFFWRHVGDAAWHPLGDAASNEVLTSWHEPLRYGLLLDGPQGSQVTFSNYRAASGDVASVEGPQSTMTAMLVNGQ